MTTVVSELSVSSRRSRTRVSVCRVSVDSVDFDNHLLRQLDAHPLTMAYWRRWTRNQDQAPSAPIRRVDFGDGAVGEREAFMDFMHQGRHATKLGTVDREVSPGRGCLGGGVHSTTGAPGRWSGSASGLHPRPPPELIKVLEGEQCDRDDGLHCQKAQRVPRRGLNTPGNGRRH